MRSSPLELAALALLVAGGACLRWVHLGTPSLWWDEVVQIAMAQAGRVGDVLRLVRHGVPHGSGNAGAMPLDYLLLHAWLTVAPAPSPRWLEVHFRLPAFVWSVAALALFAAFARRHLERDAGLVATLLLAVSLPHVLYAAEVRWYALLVLVTVGHVWAFARLLDAPTAPGRWLTWLAIGAASLLTAVLSAIPLTAELAVLAATAGRSRRARAGVAASVAVLALLIAWLAAPSAGVDYGRPSGARPGQLATAVQVLGFLAWNDAVLLAALACGVWFAWRRHRRLTVALALAFGAIPLVTAVAEWKAYYVHPRHLIFLLVPFVTLAGCGIAGVCRAVAGRRWGLAAAVALVAATQAPTVARYLVDPDPFFARTKTLRDVRGVVATLPAPPPGSRWLLLAERQSVPNAVLDRYLAWWGLADRVAFRGTRDVPAALRLLADAAAPVTGLALPPLATIPVGLTGDLRALLRIAADTNPPGAPLAGATLVTWEPPPAPPPAGLVRRTLAGVQVFDRQRGQP